MLNVLLAWKYIHKNLATYANIVAIAAPYTPHIGMKYTYPRVMIAILISVAYTN